MTRKRNRPQGTTLERIGKDYEKVIFQRHKDFQDGYNKAKDKACEWLEKWFVDSKYYTPQEALESLRKYMED